jgi:hypothetical protein
MKITKELLEKLSKNALRVAMILGNRREGEFDKCQIYSDGTMNVVFSWTSCGQYDEDSIEVTMEELEMSDDELREKKKEIDMKENARKEERLKAKKDREDERDREEFKRLKEKLGE